MLTYFDVNLNRVTGMTISLTDVQEHLPQSVAELEFLASNISETQLHEVPSLSPRYEYTKHQLLPFFVIPGISSSRIERLTQQLMHPVFCPTLPPSLPTVKQCASYLLEVRYRLLPVIGLRLYYE